MRTARCAAYRQDAITLRPGRAIRVALLDAPHPPEQWNRRLEGIRRHSGDTSWWQDWAMQTNDLQARLSRLSPLQYAVTQEGQTERAFTGVYWDHHEEGTYRCVVCSTPLFDSGTKFESGSGWPSFYDVVESGRVTTRDDNAFGMRRIEALCATCGAHLGHVFPDGPRPTGLRYCMNSASLEFAPRAEPEG